MRKTRHVIVANGIGFVLLIIGWYIQYFEHKFDPVAILSAFHQMGFAGFGADHYWRLFTPVVEF